MHDIIPVADIMVSEVVTAPTDASATEAARLMRDESVSSVVVTDESHPVGIVSEGDFITHLCDRDDLGHRRIADVMSSPLETVAPDDSLVEAVATLRAADVEHLPVVTNGQLEGILTTTELSYFVPHLVHRRQRLDHLPPTRTVRSDTAYERDEWAFEYHGDDETTVSVGDCARFTKTISQQDVEGFAEVTGDTNRVHLDSEYAADTRFGEPIVHGILANGIISAALARLPGLTIYLSQESSFLAPLAIGDRVTAECEIAEALGESKYRIDTTVTDGDGAVVLDGDAVVLIDPLPDLVEDTTA